MARDSRLESWVRDYATRLRERASDLDRYVESSLIAREARKDRSDSAPVTRAGRTDGGRIRAGELLGKDAPKRCLLLGPPGCGKTATLKMMAARLIDEFLAGKTARFPLLLPGHEVGPQDGNLWDAVERTVFFLTPGVKSA